MLKDTLTVTNICHEVILRSREVTDRPEHALATNLFFASPLCNDCSHDWFSYVRNVEYGKYHEPIYRTLEKFSQSTGNQDIDIAAFQVENLITIFDLSIFQLYFPSLAITVHNQIDDYTTNQFVSELGGAAGIVLGVSLYTIVKSEFFYDDYGP